MSLALLAIVLLAVVTVLGKRFAKGMRRLGVISGLICGLVGAIPGAVGFGPTASLFGLVVGFSVPVVTVYAFTWVGVGFAKFREGMRRLGIALGSLGGIGGGFFAYGTMDISGVRGAAKVLGCALVGCFLLWAFIRALTWAGEGFFDRDT